MTSNDLYHPSAIIDQGASIGQGTRIWHFSHVMSGAVIGEDCTLGQNVFVANGVRIGHRVKIQNNVSIYDGVVLENDVFCGPSCVFTNVKNPRSTIVRKHQFETTHVKEGATLGANATIVCGTTIGKFAFIAAGAVVTSGEVADFALMVGAPAVRRGWVGKRGVALTAHDDEFRCSESGERYREVSPNVLRCLDDEADRESSAHI